MEAESFRPGAAGGSSSEVLSLWRDAQVAEAGGSDLVPEDIGPNASGDLGGHDCPLGRLGEGEVALCPAPTNSMVRFGRAGADSGPRHRGVY